MLNLNLGSGKRNIDGYVNIDAIKQTEDTVVGDILNLNYKSGEVDKIFSEHVIEHLTRSELDMFFAECNRMLKQGGELELIAPCMITMIYKYVNKENFGKYNTIFVDIVELENSLWGTHRHPYDYHKQGIYKEKLEMLCRTYGFVIQEIRCQDRVHSENEIYLLAIKI